jgi:hypothetical protein
LLRRHDAQRQEGDRKRYSDVKPARRGERRGGPSFARRRLSKQIRARNGTVTKKPDAVDGVLHAQVSMDRMNLGRLDEHLSVIERHPGSARDVGNAEDLSRR